MGGLISDPMVLKTQAQEGTAAASVVIPAHNEAPVLHRCLNALTRTMEPGEMEIIVVCNGCTDDTAEVARSFGSAVTKVVETDVASKSHALNLGDSHATCFPRIYLDADVIMPIESARRMARVLREEPILAAAPRLEFDLDECSWFVRAFYRVWHLQPYSNENPIGSGVHGLSAAGRSLFQDFPDLLSDDGYVSLLVGREQRKVVLDAWFRTRPPANLRMLIKVRSRHQRSTYQLRDDFPELMKTEPRSYQGFLRGIMKQPGLWPQVSVYAGVFVATRLIGWAQYRFMTDPMTWERDETSRQARGPAEKKMSRESRSPVPSAGFA